MEFIKTILILLAGVFCIVAGIKGWTGFWSLRMGVYDSPTIKFIDRVLYIGLGISLSGLSFGILF